MSTKSSRLLQRRPSTASVKAASEGLVNSSAFEALSRAGFIARSLVYAIIGVLALRRALGDGGKITNQQGAFHTVAHQRFGGFLLALVAVGLGGYSLWRLVRAALGQGPEGSDSGPDRLAAAASGIAYGVLCVLAVEVLIGSSGTSSTKAPRETAGVLSWPAGVWIVGIAGAAVIGVALYQGYRGVTRSFLQDSKTGEMSPNVRRSIEVAGIIGYLARMVVFGLVGIFLVKAALDFRPSAAVGLDGALAKLLHHPYGPYLLGVVSAGLIAFAAYSLSDARYRKI